MEGCRGNGTSYTKKEENIIMYRYHPYHYGVINWLSDWIPDPSENNIDSNDNIIGGTLG
jgi:hypothetical protein